MEPHEFHLLSVISVMVVIGIDIGQRTEPSALCVVELQDRPSPHGTETHYFVRHLETLDRGTSYPDLADRSAQVAARVASRARTRTVLYLDATGLGEPVLDLFSSRVRDAQVVAVYFPMEIAGPHRPPRSSTSARLTSSPGSRRRSSSGSPPATDSRCGDSGELSCSTSRLTYPRTPTIAMVPFRVGSRDELVTALGLASQPKPPRGPGFFYLR